MEPEGHRRLSTTEGFGLILIIVVSSLKGLGFQTWAYPAFRAKRWRSMLGYPVSSREAGLISGNFRARRIMQHRPYLMATSLFISPE